MLIVFRSLGFLVLILLSNCASLEKKTRQAPDNFVEPNYCEKNILRAQRLKHDLINSKTDNNLAKKLENFNDLLITLDQTHNLANFLLHAHPDKKQRSQAQKCINKTELFTDDIYTNKKIYEIFYKNKENILQEDEQRVLARILKDFTRAGASLSRAHKSRVNKLKKELGELEEIFNLNIHHDKLAINISNSEDLVGLSKSYIKAHKMTSPHIFEISHNKSDYAYFMAHAVNYEHRKNMHEKFMARGHKNKELLPLIIKKRQQLAQELNYSSYAHFIAEKNIINNTKSLKSFIDSIAEITKPAADKEYARLLGIKSRYIPGAKNIQTYESNFFQEALKREELKSDADSQALPYFSYNSVLDGLLKITSDIFGIEYKQIHNAQLWHPSVLAYDVYENAEKIGRIYLDMQHRLGKYPGTAQFPLIFGIKDRYLPESVLLSSVSEFLSYSQLTTIFHEFGHGLHHVFSGKQKWLSDSRIINESDFVEAVAHYFEELARSPEVLSVFAKHFETKQSIPSELVYKLRRTHEFGKALSLREQMLYAALNIAIFDTENKLEPLEYFKKLESRYSYYARETSNFIYNFAELNYPINSYFTELWALGVGKDLVEPFKITGISDQAQARRFRDLILKQGISKDPQLIIQDFLGREYNLNAFSQWLKSDDIT